MKRFRLLTLVCVLLAATLVTVTVAAAGNGAKTTPFKAAYLNGPGGYFTCSGAHIVKTAPKAFIEDSETCAMSDVSTWPAGTYVIGVTAFWVSDFNGVTATSGTIVVTDNGNGTGTMQIEAYY